MVYMTKAQYINWLWSRADAERHHPNHLAVILKLVMTTDPREFEHAS